MLHTGTTKMMLGKGPSKPHRYTLASARGHELQMIPYKKLGEVPSELYEHLQGFPIGWTAGIPSTARKAKLGNAVQPKVVTAIIERLKDN
jgi:site-specific DNA-cytosine methylase